MQIHSIEEGGSSVDSGSTVVEVSSGCVVTVGMLVVVEVVVSQGKICWLPMVVVDEIGDVVGWTSTSLFILFLS